MKQFYQYLKQKPVSGMVLITILSLGLNMYGMEHDLFNNGQNLVVCNEFSSGTENTGESKENSGDQFFVEDWNTGSFGTNGWSFIPSQGNWSVNLVEGNPAPAVMFHYQPEVTNYSYSLVSPVINIESTENLTLSFDLTLSDYAGNGNEHFKVWVLNDASWELITEFTNTVDIPWTTFFYDVSNIVTNQTKLRFEATGHSSYDINYWWLDNIQLYLEQPPSFELSPPSHDFGEVLVGLVSEPQAFTFLNTGTETITINSAALNGINASDFIMTDNNLYPITLNGGQSVQVEISFIPKATGAMTAELSVMVDFVNYESSLQGEGYTEAVYDLPFIEDWASGSFITNGWTFVPSQGNWSISSNEGNPAPSATFNYQPAVVNYSFSFMSPSISIEEVDGLTLSFDLDLSDYGGTRNEQLKVFVFNGTEWFQVAEINNTQDIIWTTFTYDLSNIAPGTTKLRFEATGVNSNDINYWMVDNIQLYQQEAPSFELSPLSYDFGQTLVGTSTAPQTFTLINTGGGTVVLNSVSLTGDNATEFVLDDLNTYPLNLGEGETVEVSVSFAPQSEGTMHASLIVNNSLGIFEATLSGEGYSENGYELPFVEDWTSGNFTANEWAFDPSQGNWSINSTEGNPAPSAQFFYSPAVTNYSYSLLSPVINIERVENLTLSFDLTLSDYAYNGNEHLKVWMLNGTNWVQLADFSNVQNIAWTTFTYNVGSKSAGQTQIRFEATGVNSDNINYWMIDNISVFNGMMSQSYSFISGWNSISSYITPVDPNVENLFQPIVNNLTIIRNLTGIYWPEENINTIGDFDNLSGYAIKLTENLNFNIDGNELLSREIELTPGWHYLPVLSECPVDVMDLINENPDNIIFIQDLIGVNVCWPEMNIYSLEYLEPGKAYKIKVSNTFTITFPDCLGKTHTPALLPMNSISTPWNDLNMTPSTQVTVFLNSATADFIEGDVIGAFGQENNLFGFIQFYINSKNQTIILFGDDAISNDQNGFIDGETVTYKLYRTSTGEEFSLDVEYDQGMTNNYGKYHTGSFAMITKAVLNITSIETFGSGNVVIHPNPASDKVTITLEGSSNEMAESTIFDTKGQMVIKKTFSHETDLNVSSFKSGVYYIKIKAGNINKISKLIIK